MKVSITYLNGEAVSVEADTMQEIEELINRSMNVLWGKNARTFSDNVAVNVTSVEPVQAAKFVLSALEYHVARNGNSKLKKMVTA